MNAGKLANVCTSNVTREIQVVVSSWVALMWGQKICNNMKAIWRNVNRSTLVDRKWVQDKHMSQPSLGIGL